MPRLPRLAILLGIAGLAPFLLLGFASVMPDPSGHRLPLLIGYGAVILSFLGGVHEGFAILAPGPLPGVSRASGDWALAEQRRLLGASACALIAWLALILTAYLPPAVPLALLIVAFIALPVLEQRAALHGWVPRGYMWLRWGLSAIVAAVLIAVLVLRLLGAAS
jgi:hypothetical protein